MPFHAGLSQILVLVGSLRPGDNEGAVFIHEIEVRMHPCNK